MAAEPPKSVCRNHKIFKKQNKKTTTTKKQTKNKTKKKNKKKTKKKKQKQKRMEGTYIFRLHLFGRCCHLC